jgi:hypothetical protein
MHKIIKVALAALATAGSGASTQAATNDEATPDVLAGNCIRAFGTGLGPNDLIVDTQGMISRTVNPTTPPIRVACDSSCSNNNC